MGGIFRILIELWLSDGDCKWRFGLLLIVMVLIACFVLFEIIIHSPIREAHP
jgi:hypothetical protein